MGYMSRYGLITLGLLPIGLTLSLNACVSRKSSKIASAIIDPHDIPNYDNTQIKTYRLADADCGKDAGIENIISGTYANFMGGLVTPEKADFKNFGGNPSLHSLGINQTSIGLVGEQDCSGGACSSVVDVKSRGYQLKFCRENADFPSDSIEGISLTTLVHINNIQAFYQSVGNSQPALANLEMLVMPTLVSVENGNHELKTDNLSYYPLLDHKPYVVVFPKTNSGERLWPGYNLWDSPWVVAHEVSHHIFRTNFLVKAPASSSLRDALDIVHPVLDLPRENSHRSNNDSSFKLADIAIRDVSIADLLGAMNEGFADLFGYYSVGESKEITTGFSCFQKTRDVASGVFAEGTRKTFADENIANFLSPIKVNPVARADVLLCEVPNFQGIHTIGAILAFSFDQLLSQSPQVVNATNKTIAKAKLSLDWVRRISLLNLEKMDKEALGRVLRLAVDVAAEPGIRSEQCVLIKDLFPAYAADWMRPSNYGPALSCS